MRNMQWVLIVMMVLVLLMAIFLIPSGNEEKMNEKRSYVLRADNNSLALFSGDRCIEEYGGVVISNLPATDRFRLEEGIDFEDIESARKAVEDYDG